ncbi:RNA-guided endonuclease InsQ/TnpB family protein [Bifidobacterium breve]|uniref:Putative transposase n=1 Tax=Bifidobacterium breve TaxID=1685 RepID=Q2TM44_BIFBR|nr:RNA-guided endonuclease TnpB family protein [Bifidobacterium breve]AAY16475.1 putative transposase [Bifidobacterium breve]ABE95013.1 Transposase [Bifidobacterium breve UCC2003]QFV13623.1 transposase [Bifidobacterium breve]
MQRNELARLFGCVRVTWNVSLAWQYSERRAGLGLQGYGQLSKHLTQMKRDGSYMWLNDVSCVPTQQTLRHLGCAWDMHFKSMAPDWEGPYVEEPRFKKRGKRQTAEFTRSAHWRIRHEPDGRYGYLRLPGVTGELRFRWSRDLPSEPSGLTISLERSGEYMVSFNVMRNEPDSWPEPIHEWCGIDLGLISLAVIASQDKGGATHMENIPNPHVLYEHAERLAVLQRKLSRLSKGSNRYEEQRKRVAKEHAIIKNIRRDCLHKLALKIVAENRHIALETLYPARLAKTRLGKSVLDTGWRTLVSLIEAYAARMNRQVVRIAWNEPSSQICHACGVRTGRKPLHVREWECPDCHVKHDRDANAAWNILQMAYGISHAQPHTDCENMR